MEAMFETHYHQHRAELGRDIVVVNPMDLSIAVTRRLRKSYEKTNSAAPTTWETLIPTLYHHRRPVVILEGRER